MNLPETQGNRPALTAGQRSHLTSTPIALALIAGVLHAASLAWPLSLPSGLAVSLGLQQGLPVWWLQLLALALLAGLLDRCRGSGRAGTESSNWWAGALWGWLFATAWLATTFGWAFVAMHTYGGLPAILAILAVLALAGLLALYYAGACALFVALAPTGKAYATVLFAALWLLAELARGRWLTGFGWGAAGYAHMDGPLAGFAPWLGVYGLCAITAWLAIALARIGRFRSGLAWRQRVTGLTAVALMLLAPAGCRMAVSESSKPVGRLGVTLLQGNIPQDEKFEAGSGVPLALQWYAEQLLGSRSGLVIAPETAIPLLPQQLPPAYWRLLQQRFSTGQQAALVGTPLGDYQRGYTNSVLGLKAGQSQPWQYDKQHLVPFGEFIPPFFRWFTQLMRIPLGDFNRGAPRQEPFEWQGQRLAVNICYEDLFGEEIGLQLSDPALAPTIFVNVSNLAWFGNSMAMDQHLQIARMRALEFERPFLLATNTGASAIVDHRARVISSLPRNTRAILAGEVEGRAGITPYAWWLARFGLWPLWLFAVAVVLLAARPRVRQR